MNQILSMIAFMTARFDVARRDAHERGATATEYAILVAFIALVVVVGVTLFGSKLNGWFGNLATSVTH